MASTKGHHMYTEVSYEPDCYLMFGKESAGIPEEILLDYEDTAVRIPMNPDIRSLNLSNSVAIMVYEALRQRILPECRRRDSCTDCTGGRTLLKGVLPF